MANLRKSFAIAADNKSSSRDFQEISQNELKLNPNNKIIQAYHAAALMVSSKFGFNPINRLNKFKKGKELLESIISSNPDKLELIYIRLAVQTNAPSFLKYNTDINSDKNKLLYALEQKLIQDKELKLNIQSFLNEAFQ